MQDFARFGVAPATILLPKPSVALEKWAVIACDQFTSEPEYWHQVERLAQGSPSTLNIVYPECFLGEGDARIEAIRESMHAYKQSVLSRAARGFVLVERKTSGGSRLGLVLCVDLEQYDYAPKSRSLIRATEATIAERIPPRVKIRRGAVLESPHIQLLVDDPAERLIGPLYDARDQLEKLYDFDLMLRGGHIRGWAVEGNHLDIAHDALSELFSKCNGLLFAVGDGNHSLATAKACWEELKASIPEARRRDHPARYALCEVINLHDPALRFEPIHRAVFGADSAQLSHDFVMWCRGNGMSVQATDDAHAQLYLLDAPVTILNSINPLPVAVLQPFLDEWLAAHPGASIDYIHGEDALLSLSERGACCIKLKSIDKNSLFDSVRLSGALPRKTFSMGEARDKRYYLECRSLTAD